jgi:elongation factor G
MSTGTQSIRNVALVGHGGTGKTTLLENLLFIGGAIPKAEPVESGKTVSDYQEDEIAKRISIHTSVSHVDWQGTKINMLDAPGASDFVGEVVAALRVAETAVVVVGADVGVQIETIKIWRRLNAMGMPRVVFINKVDREHASVPKALEDLRQKFGGTFVPITIPVGESAEFAGVVDIARGKAFLGSGKKLQPSEIPADMREGADDAKTALVEAAAEGDDSLMEKYLEQETLSDDEIKRGIAKGLAANKIIPVLCGSALNGTGIESFLDFLASTACPPPTQAKAESEGAETSVEVTADGKPACFVFKTSIDQFSGRLSFIKVLSGTVTGDSELQNVREGRRERITKIYTVLGKNLEDASSLPAGDIGVLIKLASVATNDSLSAADFPVRFPPLEVPQPVHAVSIHADSKKDEDKVNQSLGRFMEEDLTLRLRFNPETKESVLSGMGEQHINNVLERIRNAQKIDIQTKVPRVAYRETITKPAGSEYQHKKQTGGHGQYAKVVLEVNPLPRGEHFKFTNAIFGGAVSKGYIPGVEKGIVDGMEGGVLAGYPMTGLEARIVDGKEHPVDSSEMAFRLAAKGALKESVAKAGPVLLEPIMNLSVFVDEQYLGDVMSDLSSRRGKVQGQEPIGGGITEVKAQVPQAELLRYSIDLRARTSGTASFEMEFSHYSAITGRIAEDVIKAAATRKAEETE